MVKEDSVDSLATFCMWVGDNKSSYLSREMDGPLLSLKQFLASQGSQVGALE